MMADVKWVSARWKTTHCPTDPPSLDEMIAVTLRLLPDMRILNETQLRALATNLRILSNMAEAWANRTREGCQPVDA